MATDNKNSHQGFYYGISGVVGIIILIILTQLVIRFKSDALSILIGVLTFTIGAIGLVGIFKSILGIKEPNTPKKYIGIVINAGICILFVAVIITNVYDIYTALYA